MSGLRRPARLPVGLAIALGIEESSGHLGGPRSQRTGVMLALGSVMVPGVWLQVTQTQLWAFTKKGTILVHAAFRHGWIKAPEQ